MLENNFFGRLNKYNTNKLVIRFSDQNYTFVKNNVIHKKKFNFEFWSRDRRKCYFNNENIYK